MRKTFTLLIVLFALCAGIWATPTTITWDGTGLTGIDVYSNSGSPATSSQSLNGITVTGTTSVTDDYAGFYTSNNSTNISLSYGGTLTFSSALYEIQSIVINFEGNYGNATGWTSGEGTLTWTGSATSSVEMTNAYVSGITSIVFTVEPIPTTTITWDQTDIEAISLNCENVNDVATTPSMYGVTASLTRISAGQYTYCQFANRELWISNACGNLTFTSTAGDILRIVITSDEMYSSPYDYPAGWTYNDLAHTLTWEGAASNQVSLSGGMDFKASSIAFTLAAGATPAPASSTITWNQEDVASVQVYQNNGYENPQSQTVKEISVTAAAPASGDYSQFYSGSSSYISVENDGTLTFTAPEDNKLTRIVINCGGANYEHLATGTGWIWNGVVQKLIWHGDAAASVVLGCAESTGEIYFGDITSVEFTVVEDAAPAVPDPTPATTTITWESTDVATISLSCPNVDDVQTTPNISSKGITASLRRTSAGQYSYCQFTNSEPWISNCGEITFTSSVGNISGILITCDSYNDVWSHTNLSAGWTYNGDEAKTFTWTGTPSSTVTLSGYIDFLITSIEFTVQIGSASADPEPTPAGPSFTWQAQQINHVSLYPQSVSDTETTPVIKNVITSLTRTGNGEFCRFDNGEIVISNCGELAFQSIVGDITGIVITCNTSYYLYADDLPADWTYDDVAGTLTWDGTAAETVTLSGTLDLTLTSIEFSYTPAAAPYLGDEFYGYNSHKFKVTGPKTVSMPAQFLNGSLLIPSTVEYMGDTYYVTEIEDFAFYNQVNASNVMSVSNGGGKHLAKIGAHAFDGCIRMDEVSLNSSVLDTIGDAAFKNCKLMTTFELWTEQPPVLGTNAFEGDTYLHHVNVETYSVDNYKAATGWTAYAGMISAMYALPSVGEQFFYHNQTTSGLYQVTYASNTRKEAKVLPYNAEVNAIYPITFEGTLVIPEEVTYIHNQYSITGIGENAYKDSTRFNMVLLPLAVKSIESGAFRGCTGVEKVFFLWDDPTTVTWADATVGAEFKTAASHGTQIFVPQGRLAAYQAWAPAWADCMFEGELFDMTASQDPNNNLRHYCTFYDSTTDYLLPPSVWANVGVVSGGNFLIWPIVFDGEILPRGTAVVLESETPEYRLIPTGNTAPLYTGPNDLIGTDVTISRTSVGNNGENVYVLGKQATINDELHFGMGLYRYTGTNLGAHKAYMILNTSSGPNSAPIRFLFKHENQATDIENVQDNAQCTKILRDGQLIIIKDGKEYNAQGIIIK